MEEQKAETRPARKIGILGGTFDPVHLGHLRLAEECRRKLELEEVWFIPAPHPPHKNGEIAPYEKRRRWLELALAERGWARISDIELTFAGKSYTYQTLLALHAQEPDVRFYFLTGADSLTTLTSWYRWEDILDLCCFVATTRPGYPIEIPEPLRSEAARRRGGVLCLEIDALDISSTAVRERLLLRQPVDDLLPRAIIDEVKSYMETQMEGYREMLQTRLSPKRYAHSLGVANTAAGLAGLYGGDIQRAYLAGLLHDYCRETPSGVLLDLAVEHNLYNDEVDLLQPDLLHGPVGAWQLEQDGIVHDAQILSAIRWHTTGHPEMDQLGRIIYIADYIEPNRTFPGVDDLRKIARRELDLSVLAGLDHTIGFLLSQGAFLHPLSVATRNRLLEERRDRRGS